MRGNIEELMDVWENGAIALREAEVLINGLVAEVKELTALNEKLREELWWKNVKVDQYLDE